LEKLIEVRIVEEISVGVIQEEPRNGETTILAKDLSLYIRQNEDTPTETQRAIH
jgi:hypothetical protein